MSEANPHADSGLSPTTPVSVVVINYEGSARLVHSLPAIAALEGEVTEVIFVDNASSDDSIERARELLPKATIIETGANLGPAAARNTGLEAAKLRLAIL